MSDNCLTPSNNGSREHQEVGLSEEIQLVTELPPDEVARRLKAALPTTRLSSLLAGFRWGQVLGEVGTDTFTLSRVPPAFSNAWNLSMVGRFVPHQEGTLIEGRFDVSPFVKTFMKVWFGFMGLFTIFVLVAIVLQGMGIRRYEFPPYRLLFLVGAIVISGYLIQRVGTWVGRRQRGPILGFLERTIHARESSSA